MSSAEIADLRREIEELKRQLRGVPIRIPSVQPMQVGLYASTPGYGGRTTFSFVNNANWTDIPSHVCDKICTLYLTGGGGGGGGRSSSTLNHSGGTGNPGNLLMMPIFVPGGSQYKATIGVGGAGGAANSYGGRGGTTTLTLKIDGVTYTIAARGGYEGRPGGTFAGGEAVMTDPIGPISLLAPIPRSDGYSTGRIVVLTQGGYGGDGGSRYGSSVNGEDGGNGTAFLSY